jgi:hypothetical protein
MARLFVRGDRGLRDGQARAGAGTRRKAQGVAQHVFDGAAQAVGVAPPARGWGACWPTSPRVSLDRNTAHKMFELLIRMN